MSRTALNDVWHGEGGLRMKVLKILIRGKGDPVILGSFFKDSSSSCNDEAKTDCLFSIAGTGLCLSIVWCNLAVSRALSRLSRKAGALRRVTRSSSRAKPLLTVTGPPSEVVTTAEERAFARLMAVLSISFVICWMPQMVRNSRYIRSL